MKSTTRAGAIVAMGTVALTLASCGFGGGGGGTGDSDGMTLDLLVPSYSDQTQGLWEDVIDGFEDTNPDIDVKLEVQSWDNLESVISNKVQSGEAPDIYNGGPFAGFASDDLLYAAADVTSPDTLSDFQVSFLANEQLEGTTYALPFIASARALFVNNALLEQAGVAAPPTTWDELLDAATKVSALGNGIAGYGMPLGSEEAQAEAAVWLWGGGGTFGDESAITIDDPANLPGAEQIKKMIDANKDYMVEVRTGQEFDKARHQAEKSLEEIEALFPQVSDAIAGSDFGQDAVKKARAVVERTRLAIGAKDLTALADATEALNRTLNMFRGVVSKTRG